MNKEKIITLIQSPILEDVIIGLTILLTTNTEEQVIDFFNNNAPRSSFTGSTLYFSKHSFKRVINHDSQWVLCKYKNFGIFVRQEVLIGNYNEIKLLIGSMYKEIEL